MAAVSTQADISVALIYRPLTNIQYPETVAICGRNDAV